MVTVFGLGFVGLTTALGFAHYGYKVYGIDVDERKKEILRTGEVPFLEPHLSDELECAFEKNLLSITENVEEAISDSEYIFYCVGTPYGENGEADLTYLYQALDETIQNIKKESSKKTLIIKSTVPPTTVEEKIVPYLEKKGLVNGTDIDVVNNPEFLREGHCWEDFVYADRIVVGCNASESDVADKMNRLYQPFQIPFYCVSYNTAEFIKYLSNTLLATLISYSNEMALLADNIGGIDIAGAFHILHEDKRWKTGNMSSYFYPGCGYGGYCLPKDTNALYALAQNRKVDTPILRDVIYTNEQMPELIAERILRELKQGDKIGICGLSFKPNSNDVRDSSSAKIIRVLEKHHVANIIAYDPVAMDEFEDTYHMNLIYVSSLDEIMERADLIVVLTAWEEFKQIRGRNKQKRVLDYRYYLEH